MSVSKYISRLPFHSRTGDLVFPAVQANAQASPRVLSRGAYHSPRVLSRGVYHRHKRWATPAVACPCSSQSPTLLPRSYGQQSFTFHTALDTQVPQTNTDDETSLRAKRQQPDICIKGKMYVQT